ncbi:MAG: UPF0182 family protein [Limnospira sp. PMC 1240.20]|uniref:UPF0182 family protein n=1 Tax=unclassified Limnospira TaxID=2642885 RepID=UPI0028E0E3F6|nr:MULTISPECIES: UPF0182 family protein [unclassified Limnospira]MDT9194338.1 UPF0182 family protein [Limnospira sp. PMC 1245.20]MDT9204729.1 UPF0182 family protein [Limnospira sp. PMC 1243.20]MDT9209744.1 UPF0182 family protein [Limnospira sp. PMC 1252.20]MDT9214980.1 UPF0182 family protein [Limnospira sp. PMC 1256.20]MDT9220154.1 UPF0182 family protein [Limnospira sp. PMC 1240.20]
MAGAETSTHGQYHQKRSPDTRSTPDAKMVKARKSNLLDAMISKNWILKALLFLFGAWLIFDMITWVIAEYLWFDEVGYLSVFRRRLLTQVGLWVLGVGLSAAFLFFNLAIADKFRYQSAIKSYHRFEDALFSPPPPSSPPALNLPWLSFLVIGPTMFMVVMILHYGYEFITDFNISLEQDLVVPLLPRRFDFAVIWEMITQQPIQWWQIGLSVALTMAVIIKPQLSLSAIAVFFSLGFGWVLSSHWINVLGFFYPTDFQITEGVFNKDISFYIFIISAIDLVEFWLFGLFILTLISCTLIYLLSGDSFNQGKFPGFSRFQQRHLHGLAGVFMLSMALRYWLNRYELLYSERGVVFGAGYTDVNVAEPAYSWLFFISILFALFLFWQAFFSVEVIKPYVEFFLKRMGLRRWRSQPKRYAKLFADSYSLRAILSVYILMGFFANVWLPEIVQRVIVQPNELERELPYIERNIQFTQKGFHLDNIDIQTFDPDAQLTLADLESNSLTIDNIRLWDQRPLLQTNRQLQQIRPYYEFLDAAIDRYTLLKPEEEQTPDNRTQKQQVIIAGRELDYQLVPEKAQTWINEHLVYTHGYGFTLSPVNKVAEGGLPKYFIKNIGPAPRFNPDTTLEVDPRVEDSIPIGKPRIYYGQLTNTNVMTGTRVLEFDFPSGDENVYNTYSGDGGIPINSLWRRLLFAKYLKNWQMIFTRNFLPETKVLFRRQIQQRVKAIAPFLRYDKNPYLVAADSSLGQDVVPENAQEGKYLYWILDAYTTSSRYPYSDPEDGEFNYIRNSVKVVIDAYNGSIKFYYLSEPRDPLLITLRNIFPDLFEPIENMPKSLYEHIRYPQDLFTVQSERLLTYHMQDARVFYNREDVWRIPTEIYGGQTQRVAPYYLIMKLPTEAMAEFILLQPFTPASRLNLIAWLAARSDSPQYGKLLLYQFPKQRLVFGPEQVEALINQEPRISEQISLWNRQGSRVLQGNLLVIPIEQSLLYVEPIYLEATDNSLPTLVRVIVAYENRIVMRPTLDESLQAVFDADPIEPAIIVPN